MRVLNNKKACTLFSVTTLILSLVFILFIHIPVVEAEQAVGSGSGDGVFSVIVIPDTQGTLCWGYNDAFNATTEWIVDNTNTYNVRFTVHLGDMVEDGGTYPDSNCDSTSAEQWVMATNAMNRLFDNDTPWLGIPGNHDYEGGGDWPAFPDPCDDTNWNINFSYTRFKNCLNNATDSYWGGNYPSDKSNNMYGFFNASEREFIVLGLELCPNNSVLTWADNILDNHPKKHAIVFTHAHIMIDNTYSPPAVATQYGACPGSENVGQGVWNKLLQYHDNICLVLSGHHTGEEGGQYGSYGEKTGTVPAEYQNDNFSDTIYQHMMNYQMEGAGHGNGTIRIYEFDTNINQINISTYTPYTDTWREDGLNDQTLSYNLSYTGENEEGTQFISINGGANGTAIYNSTPTFNWTKTSGATQYHLQISNDSAFSDLVVNLSNINEINYPSEYDDSVNVSFTLPDAYALIDYKTYYCRVRAYTS